MTRGLPAGGDLLDRVPHVERREELSLLDVDDAPGAGRGDEQVGLPRQERRNLQDVGDLGRPAPPATARGCR